MAIKSRKYTLKGRHWFARIFLNFIDIFCKQRLTRVDLPDLNMRISSQL